MLVDQPPRRVDVDDAAVLDDRNAIAQPLRLLHQVRGHEHGLAAGTDAAHQLPDGAAGLRIEAGRQLIEEHDFGIVDERQRDEQPLLLSARQRHEPGVALFGKTELLEKTLALADGLLVERRPQVHRFPHLDAFLEMGLLELDTDAILQLIDVAKRIEAQDGNAAAVGSPNPLHAFHRRGFSGAVGPDQPEDLAVPDFERHVIDGDRLLVGFADPGDGDYGARRNLHGLMCTKAPEPSATSTSIRNVSGAAR